VRFLLDTCTFIWLATDVSSLSSTTQELLGDRANELLLSPVSTWEMSIKYARGRLDLSERPDRWVPKFRKLNAIDSLPLTEESVLYLSGLPSHHTDPFDRMLVCQAIAEGVTILTPDELIRQYPVRTIW
jgi:PIN domain nuclease of toxin-antitoxin system